MNVFPRSSYGFASNASIHVKAVFAITVVIRVTARLRMYVNVCCVGKRLCAMYQLVSPMSLHCLCVHNVYACC